MTLAAVLAGSYALRREVDPGAADRAGSSASTTADATSTTATAPADPDPSPPQVATATPTDRFVVAPGSGPVIGAGGPVQTFTVEIEVGIALEAGTFAAAVESTLADPRGWTAPGTVRLQRVGPEADPTFRVRLATPATVDAHCAPLETVGRYSCRNGEDVMINLTRWTEGAAPSEMTLEDYRDYVISHEVGHALGHHHLSCPAPGALASVMQQQTKGLEGCRPNPWPYPDAS